jgi:hypothetical protein
MSTKFKKVQVLTRTKMDYFSPDSFDHHAFNSGIQQQSPKKNRVNPSDQFEKGYGDQPNPTVFSSAGRF